MVYYPSLNSIYLPFTEDTGSISNFDTKTLLTNATLTGIGNSAPVYFYAGEAAVAVISNVTFSATLSIEQSFDGGQNWSVLQSGITYSASAQYLSYDIQNNCHLRVKCDSYTSGTVTFGFELAPSIIFSVNDHRGTKILTVHDSGIDVAGVLRPFRLEIGTIAGGGYLTSPAAEIDTLTAVAYGVTPVGITDPQVNHIQFLRSNAASVPELNIAMNAGAGNPVINADTPSAIEGWQIRTVHGQVTLASSTAIATIPSGAVILSVQANVETLAVAGGTSTKIGIGADADPDEYGLTSALTKNLKINTLPAYAVLGSAKDLEVQPCANDGSAGDTVFSAGVVRVLIVYMVLVSLADAA